ncbi:CPBP family intramembrane glutamic endopeptidase [Pseudocolwellia sp. HL-MZ19]|uniref:CPBP family intramembrane glutamic endopeptidase n=1 Tax=Pseudocolwellia sp. HL-MZ19 TaxID=3400846 RepID=UPI003CF757DA
MGPVILISLISDAAGFLSYIGFVDGNIGTSFSWFLAAIIVFLYCASASKISDVKLYMFKFDLLKFVAVLAAVCAGILEEVIFRKWVMDYLNANDYSLVLQVVLSGLSFGAVHLLWGVKNLAAGINAIISTSILGAALAIVYIVGDRSLAPCIIAHFIITALIEPGLIIAAKNDRLGYWSEKTN